MGLGTTEYNQSAHMSEAEPKFLDRLQQIFTKHHTWALTSRTTPIRPHTHSSSSSKWCAWKKKCAAA